MKSRLFLVTFLLVLWGGVTFGQGRGTEKRITASFSGIPLSEAIGIIDKTKCAGIQNQMRLFGG